MFKMFKKFSKDENGAVTVDWVVLTAAVVVLAAGVAGIIVANGDGSPLKTLQTKITDAISATNAPTTP